VLESALGQLKRGGHVEDLLAVLNRDHATGREVIAVARAVDLVDDRGIDVAAAQEVGVQGMRVAPFDRRARRHQRLPEHLAAEHLGAADVAALAAKQVELETLERHHLDQILEKPVHG